MLEYEIRLLPDDECILFVRGENPIRDKKWFPWEHQEYETARKCGAYLPDRAAAEDGMIKSIIRPELTEAEVQEKKRAWMEMRGK